MERRRMATDAVAGGQGPNPPGGCRAIRGALNATISGAHVVRQQVNCRRVLPGKRASGNQMTRDRCRIRPTAPDALQVYVRTMTVVVSARSADCSPVGESYDE